MFDVKPDRLNPRIIHFHTTPQWKEEWPQAILYGCPGLKAKDSAYDEEVGDDAPAAWLGEIEAAHAKYEAVPIFNRPFFSEVML